MNFNDRNIWPQKARQALEEFATLGIDMPKPVADAVTVLRQIEAAEPTTPSATAIREAFIAGADRKQIDKLVVDDLGATRLKSEWTQAKTDSAGAVLAAIRNAEPVLMPALRALADDLIGKLRRTADLGDIRLEVLIRAGRQSEAALLADLDVTAHALHHLYELRDRYLTRGGGKSLLVNGVSCSTWQDPDGAAAHSRGKTVAEQYISALAAGVPMWFPAPSEAIEAASQIANKRTAEAERKREREFGVGSVVYLGG